MATDIESVRTFLRERERVRDEQHEVERQRVAEMARQAARQVMPVFSAVRRAYLFGSVMRPKTMRRDSDVDIAVEGSLTAEEFFALWREMERAIPDREVEIVELDKNLHFAERVRETGEIIYERKDSSG